MWVFYGLVSALFLAAYDVIRKYSLNNNPVLPVLFLASATAGLVFVPLVVLSFISGALFFSEQNMRRKSFALAGILTGIVLIIFGTIG
ncbi:hypothetical protein ES705_22276 [subsurface metagenome]